MSKQHPIIAITGSSGAGTSTVRVAMEHIFRRDGIKAAIVEGDSFHRYDRLEMQRQVELALQEGRHLSHFGPEGNLFDRLEALFMEYSERGTGLRRHYLHDQEEAKPYGQEPGAF
ncbi:MAG: phosphoribulokinase, partial [Anaerolineales bacterium]|nr:phosphoribulokinase [Anaerolineales bacterium]